MQTISEDPAPESGHIWAISFKGLVNDLPTRLQDKAT